jgi:predicted ATPase
MERAAGFAHEDTAQAKLDKLDALLAQSSTFRQDAAFLAEMLSVPNDGRYPTLQLVPQQQRQKTLEALAAQLVALSQSKPVLMIFEDAHWIDPTSLEVLGRTVDQIRTLKVLLVVTFRPEFEPPWIGQPHVAALTVSRLGHQEIAVMIDGVTGNKLLPASIRQDIVERTDGIPLFVEEMTKSVLEAESVGDAQRTVAAVPSPAMTVPASLHASLMARLDRLGQAKRVTQVGSAIGREFSHVILSSVVDMPEAELLSALNTLVATGLLLRHGVPPRARYLFKHALVQDAAYGTLLREPRRALHARIGEAFETEFADIAESQPELLARHYTEAGLIEKAAGLWGKAGQRSLGRSALVEATEQLTRTLTLISTLPSTPALRHEEIRLQVAIITPLLHSKGYASPEAKAAAERARLLIERAETLGEAPDDPLLLFSVLYNFWAVNFVAFNGDALRELAMQFLALAEDQRATLPLTIGHRMIGAALHFTGDFARARMHYDKAIALYGSAGRSSLTVRFGTDTGIVVLSNRSNDLWPLGYPDAALADTEQALRDAREIGEAADLIYALTFASLIHIVCGRYATAVAEAQELVTLADEKGASFWKPFGMLNHGCALAVTGKASSAIQFITSGLAANRSTGSTCLMPLHLSFLSRAYAEHEQYRTAQRCIDEAMTTIEASKERWCEAEVHRIAGEIALMSSRADVATAQSHFERALTIARAQAAKSWELRTAMSIARLWRDQGKRNEAHELLAPVYGWFTEGFDTRDLKEAKWLLDDLTS